MTRLAFAADLHVDAYGSRIDPETGLNARLVDYLATTAWMAEEARRRGAEALVVAGDFTERRHPAPWLVSQIRGALSSFPGRQVYLRGNHDGEIAGGSIVTLLDDGFDEQDEAGRTGISRPRVSVGLGEFAGGRGIVDVAQEIREGQVVEERVHERQALCARLDELLEDTFAGPRDAQHVRALIEPDDRAPVAVVQRLRDHSRAGRDIEHAIRRARIDRVDERATPPRILTKREDRRDAVVRHRDPGEDALGVARGHRASLTGRLRDDQHDGQRAGGRSPSYGKQSA